MPDLSFQVERADVLRHAAVPTLAFALRIANQDAEPIRSVDLRAQIRILANQRGYSRDEQEHLADLFGEPRRWGETLRSMLWTHTGVQVPAFSESTVVDLPVPCTYDFEVVSAKYFHAVASGEIPLELLFSGTVFYAGPRGLQVSQISWEKEAHYHMPASLWHELMDAYFPNSAWLRLRKDIFDRLARYKTQAGLVTWEDAVESLLRTREEGARW